jgi:hypothetical protein
VTRLEGRSPLALTKTRVNLAVVFIFSDIQQIGEKLRPRIQLFQYACEVLVIIIQGDFDADHRYEDERWKKKAQKRRSKEGV